MSLIFGSSDPIRSSKVARAVASGKLRKIATKIYTDDMTSPVETIVQRHRLEIIAHFYPGAVISHRSAIDNKPSPAGKLHVSVPDAVAPVRKLPGLEIRLWRGPAAQPDDIPVTFGDSEKLFTASQPRALLENMQIARARAGDEPKILSKSELEHWIDRQIRIFGTDWLEQMRTRTAGVAERLGWQNEQREFQNLADALLGRRSAYRLTSDLSRSRAHGKPYDPERDILFRNLHARLAAEAFKELPAPPAPEFDNRAFWEAYFSNFIEGTKFTVEEAQSIVYAGAAAGRLQSARPEDAHDVRETYRLVADPNISAAVTESPSELIDLIKRRHARMMAGRASVEPGVLKTRNNEVGSRVFVAPELVVETLARGWTLGRALPSPVARALYVLFLMAEVHPFNDGNGRISRLCMNADLEAAGRMRLIIPTSFRSDYLTVLEALTLRSDAEPFIAFGHKLIELNSRMPFESFEKTHEYFRGTKALDEHAAPFGLPAILD
ncbi:hypothetical protein M2447_002033 [Ereboglobus sp. PH5-10]|uniref:Fic family protein n=1 Tax=Ereboglobus sp. PH5-10 TaxID=2940629 RepID=UPI002405EA3E|nr:Fic family protein [Ereboglobus sp. PH5-10]MDF9827928.1 hypothetical protein [Ereboglobus sp. PH5-10]